MVAPFEVPAALPLMQIHRSKQGDVLLLALQGHLDAECSWSVEEKLQEAIQEGERRILLDCRGLDYINSSGLKAILATHHQLKDCGGQLAVAGLIESVRAIFEMVGFNRILAIFPDPEQALRALAAPGAVT